MESSCRFSFYLQIDTDCNPLDRWESKRPVRGVGRYSRLHATVADEGLPEEPQLSTDEQSP
jgi:hypothetical protein